MRWPYLRPLFHLLDMTHPIITNPNALRFPNLHQLLQRLPHLFPTPLATTRTMDQEQIHIPILAVDLRHTLVAFLIRRVGTSTRREDFRSDKHFLPWDTRLAHGFADLALVAVELRRVDMAVAGLQGRQA